MTDPVDLHRRRSDRNRRYNVAMLVMVFVACTVLVVGGVILYVKVDAKVSHTETGYHAASVRSDCQTQNFNKIIAIVDLAFTGDKNPADYPKVSKC